MFESTEYNIDSLQDAMAEGNHRPVLAGAIFLQSRTSGAEHKISG
jgi:hypothetical protein